MSLTLVVIGVLLLALSVPTMAFPVVAHETVPLGRDPVALGPYPLEAATYFIWVEDYFPGSEDHEIFYMDVSDDSGYEDSGYHTSNKPTWRTIDGVDCEQAGGFDIPFRGDYTFTIETWDVTTEGNAVHVFIVMEDNILLSILFAAGMVCLSLGLITMGLLLRARKH